MAFLVLYSVRFLLNTFSALHHRGCDISLSLNVGHHFFQAFLRFCHNIKFCITEKYFHPVKLSFTSNFIFSCLPCSGHLRIQSHAYSVRCCLSILTRSSGISWHSYFLLSWSRISKAGFCCNLTIVSLVVRRRGEGKGDTLS